MEDYVRWYDYATLSITWWFRNKYLYEIYETNVHEIEGKIINGEIINKGLKWE